MAAAHKRVGLIGDDEAVAERFRVFFETLDYHVDVRRVLDRTSSPHDVDVIVYHVSRSDVQAERRHAARPRSRGRQMSRYWLDVLQELSESAPSVPVLVALPAGDDAADRALDSGATDVIQEEISPKVLRRRLEMLESYSRSRGASDRSSRPPTARSVSHGSRTPGALVLPLPELRNRQGRLDASLVAEYLGIPLKSLAHGVGLGYAGVHKTPDGPRLQAALLPIARVLELADAALGDRTAVLRWLNRPLQELEDESPLAVILAGEAGAVQTLLENARAGIPG